MHLGLEAGEQPFDHHGADPGIALRQRVRPEQHERTGLLPGQAGSQAARMAAHQVPLQLADPLRRDRDV